MFNVLPSNFYYRFSCVIVIAIILLGVPFLTKDRGQTTVLR
jgi:hypothetical protein